MEKDIAQFKLSSGSEVVCEVMEWPDSDNEEIIVRNAMTIIPYEQDGILMHAFKPWLHFFESPDEYLTINPNHVVASARPSSYLKANYFESVTDMNDLAEKRSYASKLNAAERVRHVEEILDKIRKGSFGFDDDGTIH